MIGAYCFCPVCLSVVNFNICYNFWTVRGRDFIFGMHTPLIMPFQMTLRSMTFMTLTLTFALKIAFLDFVAAGGIVSVSQTHLDFCLGDWTRNISDFTLGRGHNASFDHGHAKWHPNPINQWKCIYSAQILPSCILRLYPLDTMHSFCNLGSRSWHTLVLWATMEPSIIPFKRTIDNLCELWPWRYCHGSRS